MQLKFKDEMEKIDFDFTGEGLNVSIWFKGWKEGQPAAVHDFIPDGSLFAAMKQCDDAGFTVTMFNQSQGRALRGQTTRIDILEVAGRWVCRKYPKGWTARTKPLVEKDMTQQAALSAIEWCKEKNWSVREFPGGARAWRGEPIPVRTASEIRQMAKSRQENIRSGAGDKRFHFDLALDF